MTIGAYDTHTMLRVVETLHAPSNFWLSLFYPSVQTFDTEYVDFDVVDRARRLAPFVAPTVQGKPMKQEGYATRRFKPAYIKPKDVVNPTRVIKRQPGEMYAGSLSTSQRRAAVVADILQTHRDAIERRWEWMAAEAVINGQVTVTGDEYPTSVISFGQDASQGAATNNLTGAARWSETTADPSKDLENWMIQTHRLSGYAPDIAIMGLDAFRAFTAHEEVRTVLDNRRGTDSRVELATGNGLPWQFRGNWGSSLEIWTYNDIYEDEDGAAQNFLPQDHVVLGSRAVDGVRAFGAILDARAGYQATPMFPKMWEQEDPSAEFVMLQSAPLMIPTRPNAVLTAKVLNAA